MLTPPLEFTLVLFKFYEIILKSVIKICIFILVSVKLIKFNHLSINAFVNKGGAFFYLEAVSVMSQHDDRYKNSFVPVYHYITAVTICLDFKFKFFFYLCWLS